MVCDGLHRNLLSAVQHIQNFLQKKLSYLCHVPYVSISYVYAVCMYIIKLKHRADYFHKLADKTSKSVVHIIEDIMGLQSVLLLSS